MRTMDAERIVHRLAKTKGMNESFTPLFDYHRVVL